MLGARQQGGTGLPTSAVPRSFPTATGGQRHPGELCHRRPPAMYSHVHDDDHVLWGGGTLDVPVGCRRGSAGLTHFGGGPRPCWVKPKSKALPQHGRPGSCAKSARAPMAAVTTPEQGAEMRQRRASGGEDAARRGTADCQRPAARYRISLMSSKC